MTLKIALLLAVLCLRAPAFDLSRSVDRTALTVGDRVNLTLKAVKNKSEKLLFPGPDQKFGNFELLDMRGREENEGGPGGGRTVEVREYLLTIFKLGNDTIPALTVVNAADTADRKTTDPVEILVKPIPGSDSADIVDIHGQKSIGFGPLFYAVILLTLIFLSLGVFFLDRWFKKRKGRAPAAPAAPPPPPETVFERELANLLAARLLEKGEVKAFHLRISEILRRYIGSRFSFYALESTTGELLEVLRRRLTGEPLRKVESFCEINDPVKFARWIPETAVSDRLVSIAREVVQMTPPQTPQAAATAKN